ncbi:FAD-dependent oxidoreductase [Rhodococcus sp. NCIMB 12038]|uniref:FAD-dependent oxidoreductase n=1 Tax=Rhodococcus sp. NCIMB 12038 TaxID=933800 RepID=UPI000B3D3053|nr:FAD-dependent oxidoreductase [Rhodococcus sp. NCIMB 12038]
MTSLWRDRALAASSLPQAAPATASSGGEYDTVVVGAGLTGLTTGLLLARSGQRVAVVEARTAGAVTTGNTTGKVSMLQGTRLSQIARKHSSGILQSYVEGNLEGQQWLLRYCTERGVPFDTEPAITYAQHESATVRVRAEYDACRAAGLAVRFVPDIDLPVPCSGAVVLDGQAQLDPMPVLAALARDLASHGGVLVEHRRVTQVRRAGRARYRVVTEHDDFTAARVVLATGIPILDRGGFFARLVPERSYALAFAMPDGAPGGMYLSADSPTRSLRPAHGRRLLLVGGNGHVVGRSSSPQQAIDDLVDWTRRHFPGAEPTHRWSAQDYSSLDSLPYVGPLVPGRDGILVATGFGKWGMTNGVAAALALTDRILHGHMRWTDAFSSWSPTQLFDLPSMVKTNGEVAYHLVTGWTKAALHGSEDEQSGATVSQQGTVVRDGGRPVGICTVDGRANRVGAVCPHLGGVLRWNDAEQSWDCPLHGSRFDADGTLLEGPATHDLPRIDTTPRPAASALDGERRQ